MGRRSKLTPEVQKKICDYIRIGLTYERAALAAGISVATFYNWKARGEKARSGKYFDFLDALHRAEAEGEARHVAIIANEGPAGSKWILARRHPERWALIEKREISGPDGAPIQSDVIIWVAEEGDAHGEDISSQSGAKSVP